MLFQSHVLCINEKLKCFLNFINICSQSSSLKLVNQIKSKLRKLKERTETLIKEKTGKSKEQKTYLLYTLVSINFTLCVTWLRKGVQFPLNFQTSVIFKNVFTEFYKLQYHSLIAHLCCILIQNLSLMIIDCDTGTHSIFKRNFDMQKIFNSKDLFYLYGFWQISVPDLYICCNLDDKSLINSSG